nr:hypothetical protein [Kofleriaceae bacterium]
MKLVALAMIAVARVAAADVTADLAAGAGDDTAARDGYATATASVGARLDRAEAPLAARAIDARDPDTGSAECCVWLLTGLDPDERLGAGAQASGEVRTSPAGTTAVATGDAWLRAYGWGVTVGGDAQPVGGLRDRFWRSGRDVVDWHTTFDVAPMWALGTDTTQVMVIPASITVGHRAAELAGAWQDAGWDRAVDTTLVRVQRRRSTLDLGAFHYAEWGVASAHAGAVEYGTSATTFDVDAFDGTWKLDGARVTLHARFGLASRLPVGAYVETGSSEATSGPEADAADYWVELARRGDDGATQVSVGAGSWARLDPTGLAADTGQLATASLARRVGGVELTGQLATGRLRRGAVSAYAPASVAPVGTTMWLGRAEVAARWHAARRLELDGTAYVERSDRDDPRWLTAADGRVDMHAGLDVAAHWRARR